MTTQSSSRWYGPEKQAHCLCGSNWPQQALCIFGSATVTLSVQHGFGRHLYHLSFPQISEALKYSIYAEMSAYFSTFFIKISVCFFVFRLISGSQEKKVITRVLWALMAFVTLSCISSVITLAVECIPFSDIWTFTAPNRKCLPDYVQPLMIKIYGGRSLRGVNEQVTDDL